LNENWIYITWWWQRKSFFFPFFSSLPYRCDVAWVDFTFFLGFFLVFFFINAGCGRKKILNIMTFNLTLIFFFLSTFFLSSRLPPTWFHILIIPFQDTIKMFKLILVALFFFISHHFPSFFHMSTSTRVCNIVMLLWVWWSIEKNVMKLNFICKTR
jgi:hypothetical protein